MLTDAAATPNPGPSNPALLIKLHVVAPTDADENNMYARNCKITRPKQVNY